MLAQGVLPYQLEAEKQKIRMTGLAGLPLYLDLAHVVGLRDSLMENLEVRTGGQGWTDSQIVTTLILLNLSGGECVEDLEKLEDDEGFALLLHRTETYGMKRRERRELERRWRRKKKRKIPSVSAVRRFLEACHDPAIEALREPGRAFIRPKTTALLGLAKVNGDLLTSLQRHSPEPVATLDMDATLIETQKKEALFCYKKFRAYQPLNVWWAEQEVVVHSEFRDGNVPAGEKQLRVLRESLDLLPEGVEKVTMRSDSAGYQWDLLRYCAEGRNERFGVIDFAVAADVSPAFRRAVSEVAEADWMPLLRGVGERWVDVGQEWAEVCFVPQGAAVKKPGAGAEYRFLAIRESLPQLELEGTESDQAELPFPTISYPEENGPGRRYKLFGVVTNRSAEEIAGDALIRWHRERCGKSEEAHGVMKEDLAGGRLPSGLFGANAAWWGAMILALNLNSLMKRLVLGKAWVGKRMKAIRYGIINLPGRIVSHARQIKLRVSAEHTSFPLLLEARRRLAALAGPAG